MFDKISTALKSILFTLTKVQSFYDFEASNIEGFPAMTMVASSNDSDYSTTTENRRVYAFVVRLYVERGSGNDSERTCEATMRDLVDTVLDRLDKNFILSGTTVPTQSGYTFLFMSSTPSSWGYAGRENEMRVAEIRFKLNFDIDTNIIS